jgi:hypothetical protein
MELIMNKMSYLLSMLALASTSCFALVNDAGEEWTPRSEISSKIPEITFNPDTVNSDINFVQIPDVAQYKNADWSQVVGIARGVSVEEAMQIAKSNPEITYFFRTKGFQMILERTDGNYGRFRHGDTVFFKGAPHWGTAPYLADGYVKQ